MLKSHTNLIPISKEFKKTGIRKLDVSKMNDNIETINDIYNKPSSPSLTHNVWQKQQLHNNVNDVGLESNSFLNAYPSQIYILASMGCVAFLLCVIALLIVALLCNRKKRTCEMSPSCKKYPFGNSATTTTMSTTTNFDLGGRIFSNKNGEKIYFPVSTTQDDS